MKELTQSKRMVFSCLRIILTYYENRRSILKENSRTAKKETLKTYSDFYEWLQNNI